MSGARGAGGPDEFAALLRELKDRSGLSYGTLAKRLHMSTSTVHRYCNGSVVPSEYAPVERLARVCRATPQELVELHRRWILADAARGQKTDRAHGAWAAGAAVDPAPAVTSDQGAGSAGSPQTSGTGSAADAAEPVDAASTAEPGSATAQGPAATPTPGTDSPRAAASRGPGGDGDLVVVDVPRKFGPPRRRSAVLIASIAVAAVLGTVVLAANLPPGGGGSDAGGRQPAGATAVADVEEPSASASATPSPSGKSREPSASPSVSAPTTESGQVRPGASAGGGKQGAAEPGGGKQGAAEPGGGSGGVPLTVATRPYVYDNPCSQHFLVDSAPEHVGPPAFEQDAPRWAAANHAVSSGEQRVALTVQGSSEDTVVLEALHVRILGKAAPLAWNDYAMGVGCGGGVDTRSFDIDLDDGSPGVTVKNGRRDFPYKVSESDPEVFYVTAHTKAHDVRWDLTLDWSSGSRRGTLHIDDNGTPFRTSGNVGRPGYDYPLGGSEWIERAG
ncbi:transcriptional regulator [Streptomyces colonosanans]|uniref:Transcriptional regulator n=1 Tax=Streptomyces colonosanans TaxID=1428652 RepID=A0A1S2PDG2_9ACTN|nr:transcriptional regulator [Streptomyces colonosanans]OIJ90974.1 transcriptional regulator [Streptomyces colonosanans]